MKQSMLARREDRTVVTAKICLLTAMLASGGFGAIVGAVSKNQAECPDAKARLFAMLFVSATTPR